MARNASMRETGKHGGDENGFRVGNVGNPHTTFSGFDSHLRRRGAKAAEIVP
jgi:hypothetical protein